MTTRRIRKKAEVAFRRVIDLKPNDPVAYTNLGNALWHQNKRDEAVGAYRKALALKPDLAEAHYFHYLLGKALYDKGDLDGAIAEYRKAIQLKEDYPEAHTNLGVALCDEGDADGAITEYRKALRLNKDFAEAHIAHNNLGGALARKGRLDEAIAEFQKAIRLKKDFAGAHFNLGIALHDQKKLNEAVTAFRKADQLLPNHPRIRNILRLTERWLELDKQLPAILAGKVKPSSPQEQVELALFCASSKERYRTAAGFYADAFAAQPNLADNLNAQHLYNAACAAALAGCGQGKDAEQSNAKERARLRRHAHDWLRADLAAYLRLLEKQPDKVRRAVQERMQHWLEDKDFAGVRGPAALARLPEVERGDWQKLWQEVEALRQQAADPASKPKPPNPPK